MDLLARILSGELTGDALAEALAALPDDELAELETALEAAADERLDGDDPSDDDLIELERIRDGVTAVRSVAETREQAAAERRERAAALRDEIRGQSEDEGGDGEDDDAEGDGEEGDDAGDGDDGSTTTTEGDDGEGEGSGDGEEARIAAAASRRPPRIRTRARATAAMRGRRPGEGDPSRRPEPSHTGTLVAVSNAPGIQPGRSLLTASGAPDFGAIGTAFGTAFSSMKGHKRGDSTFVPVVRLGIPESDLRNAYGDDRYLDDSPVANTRKVRAVTASIAAMSDESIQAAGGICAPAPVRYDLPIVGDDARPVRDTALVGFGADRGGVRTIPPPLLTDVDTTGAAAGVSVWTNTTDTTPGANTKPCLTITCPDDDETLVEAIYRCIEFGNFRARFFSEQVEAWWELLGVWASRFIESRHLTAIGSGSTNLSAGQVLGTTRTVLAVLDRAISAMRNRHRISRNGLPLRLIAPEWLLDNMRADLSRELPGSTEERLAMSDAQIEAFFRARRVNVTWSLDGETGQIFGPQPTGALEDWITDVIVYLYPEGSWLHLDGGQLDFGLVRDSTLNSTNDVQMAFESFEAVHFHGVESQRITIAICPDGTTSGTVDLDICTRGS